MNFGDPLAAPGVRTYGPDPERSGESAHCRVCRVVGSACHYHRTLCDEHGEHLDIDRGEHRCLVCGAFTLDPDAAIAALDECYPNWRTERIA